MRQPVFGAYVAGNLQLLHSPKASDSRCGCARRQYNFAAGKRCRLLVRGCVRDRSQAPTRSNHECSLVVNHGAWFYGCPSKATHPHQQNQRFRRCIVLPAFVQRLTTTTAAINIQGRAKIAQVHSVSTEATEHARQAFQCGRRSRRPVARRTMDRPSTRRTPRTRKRGAGSSTTCISARPTPSLVGPSLAASPRGHTRPMHRTTPRPTGATPIRSGRCRCDSRTALALSPSVGATRGCARCGGRDL